MISSLKCLVRGIHGSAVINNHSLEVQSRMLKKLIKKNLNRRKNYPKVEGKMFPDVPAGEPFDRRRTAISKVYMQHITQVMETGVSKNLFLGLGLEISKVQILKGFKHINVYWISKNDVAANEKIESALKTATTEMQNEIKTMRFIGKIPEIRFVRDLTLENELKVEEIFNTADFVKDLQLTSPTDSVEDVETTNTKEEMRQDVLGLNHAKIKGRILAEKEKLKRFELPVDAGNYTDTEDKDSRNLIIFNKKTFEKFYYKAKIQLMKEQKRLNQNALYLNDENEDDDKYNNNEIEELYEEDNDFEDECKDYDFHRENEYYK